MRQLKPRDEVGHCQRVDLPTEVAPAPNLRVADRANMRPGRVQLLCAAEREAKRGTIAAGPVRVASQPLVATPAGDRRGIGAAHERRSHGDHALRERGHRGPGITIPTLAVCVRGRASPARMRLTAHRVVGHEEPLCPGKRVQTLRLPFLQLLARPLDSADCLRVARLRRPQADNRAVAKSSTYALRTGLDVDCVRQRRHRVRLPRFR